jgi:2-keto-4-pentenoate hydratase/2-oxohepta-3-ene-1,7-dioic acid hydratase in catechol pathway
MKLLSYQQNGALRLGVKTERGILDVSEAKRTLSAYVPETTYTPETLRELLEAGQEGLHHLYTLVSEAEHKSCPVLREETLCFAPSVPQPGKIICVGLNYQRHALESQMPIPKTPVLFSKFSNALAAHREAVPLPEVASEYDYEVELVVVMGKRAKNVLADEALTHVFGYCTGNDLSARDLQMQTSQWLLGKTLDKFLPLGPYLVTADEIPDPQSLRVRCWLNGEPRQDSNTADMIFSVATVISYLSRHLTLEPGDIILTGTPEGVIFGRSEKMWLKPGDEVVVEVEGLGQLANVLTPDAR